MSTVTETAHRTSRNLENALNGIFLAIGNAYYEANKTSSSPNTTNNSNGNMISASLDVNAKIRSNRAAFLDSLDQMDIMVLQATEVLERHHRLKQVQASFPDTDEAIVTVPLEDKLEGPSPVSMLLSGEALIPATTNTSTTNGGLESLTVDELQNTEILATEDSLANPVVSTDANIPLIETTQNSIDMEPIATTDDSVPPLVNQTNLAQDGLLGTKNPQDEDMMDLDGPIDFGDLVFDYNFEDDGGQFDFGAMIDAD